MMKRGVLVLMTTTLISSVSSADTTADAAMRDVLLSAAEEMTSNSLESVHTLEDWKIEREAIREDLRFMLGLDPWPEKTPLNPIVTGVHPKEAYRIENLYFESLAKFFVTANLYVPNQGDAPFPTVVYLCGHARNEAGSKGHYAHHPEWLARHGYVVLIVDAIQLSEIPGKHHGTHQGVG